MKKGLSFFRKEIFLSIISPIFVLVIWEVMARLGLLDSFFFPPPSTILKTLANTIKTGELQMHLYASLRRLFLGFFLGAVPGMLLGLSMGWSRKIRAFFDPLVAAIYPIPKIALLPLIMLIFGIGDTSKIVTVGIGCFFLVLINSMAGVINVHKIYFEVAENYGASKFKMFTKVILPGSLPMVFAGMRLALGVALLIVVAVELVTARKGLGAMVWLAWETLKTEKLYTGVLVIAILGLLLTIVLQRIEKRLIPWEEELLHK